MWLLRNATPFNAERTWVRDRDGAEVWIVAVKGSFIVRDDGMQILAPEQGEISRAPRFRGDPAQSSLLCECDLVHCKQMTDVLVEGHAVGAGGQLVETMNVRLRVANIDKTLRVHGDRVCTAGVLGLDLSRPELFTRMPIVYEKAFGGTTQNGWEARNPVGVGYSDSRGALHGARAPNIEDPLHPFKDSRSGRPAGFGPIARHWAPRVGLAGTYDDAWNDSRKPLVPHDFDELFYQAAPPDQRVDGYLRGGELVEVWGMTPDGVFSFRTPRVPLLMTTHFYDGTSAEHRPVLHTLTIFPDRRQFDIVWHSQLPCHSKVHKLKATQITQKRRVKIPRAEIESGMWIPA